MTANIAARSCRETVVLSLISSSKPRSCSHYRSPLCAPVTVHCLPRLVFRKRPRRLHIIFHWVRLLAASNLAPWGFGLYDPRFFNPPHNSQRRSPAKKEESSEASSPQKWYCCSSSPTSCQQCTHRGHSILAGFCHQVHSQK